MLCCHWNEAGKGQSIKLQTLYISEHHAARLTLHDVFSSQGLLRVKFFVNLTLLFLS